MIIKIKHLKSYQAIKVGNREKTFFSFNEYKMLYDSELGLIQIEDKQDRSYTSLNNVAWFSPVEERLINEQAQVKHEPEVKKAVSRTSKKAKTK